MSARYRLSQVATTQACRDYSAQSQSNLMGRTRDDGDGRGRKRKRLKTGEEPPSGDATDGTDEGTETTDDVNRRHQEDIDGGWQQQ